MSAGGLLVVALAAVFGACFAVAPLLCSAVSLVAFVALRRVTDARVRLLALCLAALGAWRANHDLRDFAEKRAELLSTMGATARCAGQGIILSSPTVRDGRSSLVLDAQSLDCEGRKLPGPVRIRIYGERDDLGRDDRIEFIAQLGPVSAYRNLGLWDTSPMLAARAVLASGRALAIDRMVRGSGLLNRIDRFRAHARRRILATFAPAAQAMARALVLGENNLDPEDDAAFRNSGLAHLLAVSGTHLVFAVMSLVAGLRALLVRVQVLAARWDVQRLAAGCGAVLGLIYADFAGGSGSAWRAAWMLAAAYSGRCLGRRVNGTRALALSLLVGTAFDPLVAFDISFLLSAAATFGLLVMGQRLARPLGRIRTAWLRWLGLAVATTVSAMLPCIPLLLVLSPNLTVAGIFANVLAAPLGEMAALPMCLAHTLTAPFPVLERGLALAGSGALLAVRAIAHLSASARFLAVGLPPPTPFHFGLLLASGPVAVALWAPIRRRQGQASVEPNRRILGCALGVGVAGLVLAWGVLEWAAQTAGTPRDTLRVSVLDVGQGDSILVDLPDGRLMLIDGGGAITGGRDPGLAVLAPLLRARRRRRIDVVVLSHPHPDHFGGLLTLLPTVPVGEFWEAGDPAQTAQIDSPLSALRRALQERGVAIRHLPELCKGPRWFGSARIDVLGPCPDVVPGTPANDASLVLQIHFGRRSVLLPGDAEWASETSMVARHGARLHSDLLKVGHHGSRTSTTQRWLSAVRPQTAIISSGARNRFGHPNPKTLLHLARAQAAVFRTDQVGSVIWQTDGAAVRIRTAAERVRR